MSVVRRSERPARVAGVSYAYRFDEQLVNFPICDGAVLHSLRNDDHLHCREDDVYVSQLNRQLVSVVVSVPGELAPDVLEKNSKGGVGSGQGCSYPSGRAS